MAVDVPARRARAASNAHSVYSVDVVVSNCVINLSPDKEAVLRQAHKCLKEGGELYFSDVYASRRVPQELKEDEVLWGECISGALYWNDFLNLARKCGFEDPRLVEDGKIKLGNKKVRRACAGGGLERKGQNEGGGFMAL